MHRKQRAAEVEGKLENSEKIYLSQCQFVPEHFCISVHQLFMFFLLWLSIPDTIYYQCLLVFIQASDCLILLLHPYILLDILNLLDLQLVRHFDIALFWLSNRLILVVLCILLGAKPG